ncbi:hypothetical protein ABW21_db0205713 [Orbilia brochopaga]|nr:hypothetical protein ABW21_db0205713 [Drechslerella brochopaga]
MKNYNGKPSFFSRIRNSRTLHRVLRILQFLSAIISLALFSARIARVIAIAKKASRAQGAVEGILVAAVVYTLILMVYKIIARRLGPNWLRWVLIVLDLLFVGAFIAVSDLTRPSGPAGPCPRKTYTPAVPKGQDCNLPWGTFILAIFSTILHALTAIFHQVEDHYAEQNRDMDNAEPEQHIVSRGRYS